jgi:hypothetical protein
MNTSKIERDMKGVIDKFEEQDVERVLNYQQAADRFDDLEKRGLVKKRGNSLLPIEERYKLSIEYHKGNREGR